MSFFSDKQLAALTLGIGALGYLGVKAGAKALNPLSADNVVYEGANALTRALTRREVDRFGRPLTLGAWLAGG